MKPEDFGITKYKWNNGKLDCFQDVGLSFRGLTKLPFNFGIVEGEFDCSHNKLTSLEGCPSSVEGDFFCYCNTVKFTEEDIQREMLRSKLKDQNLKDKDLDNLAAIRSLFNR